MSPILIASDLSANAELALKRACQLAQRLQVPLTVLHTVDDQLPLMARDQLCQQARDLLGAQVTLCQAGQPLQIELQVLPGRITDTILRVAAEQDAQLIVMGQHHQTQPELFIGTNLERVSRLAAAPVLLVARESGDYRQALMALDFSACASAALRAAAKLLQGGQLHALHICQPPLGLRLAGQAARDRFHEEQRETLSYLLEDEMSTLDMLGIARPQVELLIESGGVLDTLQKAVALLQPDVIALGGHSRSGLGDALLGSLAVELLRQPPCDVLVAR